MPPHLPILAQCPRPSASPSSFSCSLPRWRPSSSSANALARLPPIDPAPRTSSRPGSRQGLIIPNFELTTSGGRPITDEVPGPPHRCRFLLPPAAVHLPDAHLGRRARLAIAVKKRPRCPPARSVDLEPPTMGDSPNAHETPPSIDQWIFQRRCMKPDRPEQLHHPQGRSSLLGQDATSPINLPAAWGGGQMSNIRRPPFFVIVGPLARCRRLPRDDPRRDREHDPNTSGRGERLPSKQHASSRRGNGLYHTTARSSGAPRSTCRRVPASAGGCDVLNRPHRGPQRPRPTADLARAMQRSVCAITRHVAHLHLRA